VSTPRTAVVFPSNRELADSLLDKLHGADVIVVDGGGFKESARQRKLMGSSRSPFWVLPVDFQDNLVGRENADLIGRGSAALRNFGVWWAWKQGYEYIINLDDDCWPENDRLVGDYVNILSESHMMSVLSSSDSWVSTLHRPGKTPWYPRGFPYEERFWHSQKVTHMAHALPAVHVGLWQGTLDLNAVDKESYSGHDFELVRELYATKLFFPVCGMNFACHRDWAPFVYQIPWTSFGPTLGLERYDDVIGGLFTIALARMEGATLSFGWPFVDHRKKDTDLFTHAWRENLGNVLVSRIAQVLAHAEEVLIREDPGATRLDAMHALLASVESLVGGRDPGLEPVLTYCVKMYRRWLALFQPTSEVR
jgi:Reversibly glycosylated polypeptide